MSGITRHLITDRAQADVDRYLALRNKGYAKMDALERAEWNDGMKGAIDALHLMRISTVVHNLALALEDAGYSPGFSATDVEVIRFTGHILGRDDPGEMETLLSQVAALRAVLPLPDNTPPLPSTMDDLTFEGANAIEATLVAVEQALDRAQQSVDLGWALGIAHIGLYGRL